MSYQVRLDYATFNFLAGKMNQWEVGRQLLGQADIGFQRKGLNEGSPLNSPLGLRWMENSGYSEMPHKLEVKGVGCEHFALTLPNLRSAVECRFSRLDFAFDVITDRAAWRSFLCGAFNSSMESERCRKRFKLTGDGEAMTVYIGSRKCAKYFRIYNKTLQDPKYKYNVDGQDVDVLADQCVIRYEIELHRFKDSHHTFDPSPLFDWYYSSEKHNDLVEFLKKEWLSYGNDILLPPGFEDADFTFRIDEKNKNFVHSGEESPLEIVHKELHDYPRSFEHTLAYIADRFGAYIPYLIADQEYRNHCFEECERKFGFAPEFYIEQVTPIWKELDDLDEPEFTPFVGDQLQFEPIVKGVAE